MRRKTLGAKQNAHGHGRRGVSHGSRQRNLAGRVWLVSAVAFLGLFLAVDIALRHRGIDLATKVQTLDFKPSRTPRGSPGRIHNVVLPQSAMDARWWIIHAEHMIETGAKRIRRTGLDNYPGGREVHWSSGLVWLLVSTAAAIGNFTGRPAVDCVVDAAFVAGPITLAGSLLLLGLMILKRFGPGAAGIFILLFSTSPVIYQCFRPGETDHHGIVLVFSMASVFALVAGDLGMVGTPSRMAAKPRRRRQIEGKWFLLSGIFGGAALWVSAASFIPVLLGVAIGACSATFWGIRRGLVFEGAFWRRWGLAGCLSSLFFYGLEYFPADLGWRLEVNHPVYSLAWLGAGDLLARLVNRSGGKAFFPRGGRSVLVAAFSGLLVCAPAAIIAFRSPDCFWVSNRFLLLLHNEYISEFKGYFDAFDAEYWLSSVFEPLGYALFFFAAWIYLWVTKRISTSWNCLFLFLACPAGVMQLLAFTQIRWGIFSTGLWALCAIASLKCYLSATDPGRRILPGILATVYLAGLCLAFPLKSMLALATSHDLAAHLPKSIIPTILARDIALRLVDSRPDGVPVVLTGPTSSTELGYYGGIPTIGTLYWENLEGLRTAACIFSSRTMDDAKHQLAEHKITHIVLATWDNFGEAYVDLLKQAGEMPHDGIPLFLRQLLGMRDLPDWLRPLYYPISEGFGIPGEDVLIFEVVMDQSHFDALIHQAAFFYDCGRFDEAEKALVEARALRGENGGLDKFIEDVRSKQTGGERGGSESRPPPKPPAEMHKSKTHAAP
jgi:hypothetical protein